MPLTDTQMILLSAASQRDDGLIARPANMAETAANAGLAALLRKQLADEVRVGRDQPHWRIDDETGAIGLRINAAGLDALGLSAGPDDIAPVVPAPAPEATPRAAAAPRAGSKPAAVLALIGRAEGATIAELAGATGWLPHSVRAVISGLRKAGTAIVRAEHPRGPVYRLGPMVAASAEVPA